MITTSQINETTLTLPYNARQTIEVAATMELPYSTTLKVEVDYTLLHYSIGYICTRPSVSISI